MISDERLENFAHDKRMCNVTEEITSMAKELLALRKAFSETAVYEAEINGVMSSVTKSHYELCKDYGVRTRQLIVKPATHE